MTPTQRTAALRLADALELPTAQAEDWLDEAAALLRELAAEPVQAPVDCGEAGHAEGRCGNASCCAKPVAWMGVHDRTDLFYRKPSQVEVIPLYAAPQQRKQLTDNEISDLILACEEENGGEACSYHDLARAVEAAHSIKETP